MSNQLETIKDNIKAAIATCTAKITPYYPSATDWATKHIFYGSNPLIHNQNRGRQIICHFYRDTTTYLNESDGAAGTLNTVWVLELSAFRKPASGATKIYDEEGFEDALDDIFSSIIYAIRATNGLNLSGGTDSEIERIALVPHGFTYKTKIALNNSWVNSDRT
jgi:hypothetical protein